MSRIGSKKVGKRNTHTHSVNVYLTFLPLIGEMVHASLQLRALHCLLQRSGKSDRQCEELGEFIEKTKELDKELRDTVKKMKIEDRRGDKKEEKKAGKKKAKEGEVGGGGVEMSDKMAEVVHRAKGANKVLFLSGERKKEMVEKRKGDELLNKEYYSYVF